ncbi:unnamed protein product [Gadus morhua 'NCC']
MNRGRAERQRAYHAVNETLRNDDPPMEPRSGAPLKVVQVAIWCRRLTREVELHSMHNEGRFPDSLVCTVLLIQLVLMADEALCT